jgi:ubiquinone/menaquinone biosynthesis C-methylase UbiE
MNNNELNPWLKIPAEDYEGHMSDENVGQLQALNEIFRNVLKDIAPNSLCVLGCTTGNGFEHINRVITKRITCVDINIGYLRILDERYGQMLNGLELICDDLEQINLHTGSFDLIYGALVFEYINVSAALEKISSWLNKKGVLAVVLQMKTENMNAVSETPFHSLKYLNSLFNYVEPEIFEKAANEIGLSKKKSCIYDLNSGKKFYIGYFIKE